MEGKGISMYGADGLVDVLLCHCVIHSAVFIKEDGSGCKQPTRELAHRTQGTR